VPSFLHTGLEYTISMAKQCYDDLDFPLLCLEHVQVILRPDKEIELKWMQK
jgi:hypothetical protein